MVHPGEHVPNHRHNSVAIYHYLQGTGTSTVEGTPYAFKPGDTIVCPAWAYHEHDSTGDKDVLIYTVQDMPEMAAKRTLFFEEHWCIVCWCILHLVEAGLFELYLTLSLARVDALR